MSRLSDIHNEYEAIVHSDATVIQKDKALAALMTRMEQEFHVPALANETWQRENKSIISLYRIISESRKTLF